VSDSKNGVLKEEFARRLHPQIQNAMQELIRGKNRQFDAQIVDVFLGMIEKMGVTEFARHFGLSNLEN
jgi:hypothetical protein